jgi:hypothetical protein
MNERLMPKKLELGENFASCLSSVIFNAEGGEYLTSGRSVMGYNLPTWQRPFVWTEEQSIKLLESVWLGLSIGTYTFNRSHDNPAFDNLLIDGQQRLKAIQDYLSDEFKVFGYYWSELSRPEQLGFKGRHFHSFVTKRDDETYLRSYYDMMNFGGTAHEDSQRAT